MHQSLTMPRLLHRRAWLRGAAAAVVGVTGGSLVGRLSAQTRLPGLPVEVAPDLPNALFTGQARLRFWGFDVYDSRLWVAKGFQAANYAEHGFALELQYLRSLEGDAIAERSLAEMKRLGALRQDQETRWLAAMREAFPNVKAGDRIVGLNTPGAGVRFWHNGQSRPGVPDVDFGRWFFGIWLSENTREPRLRQSLLERLQP